MKETLMFQSLPGNSKMVSNQFFTAVSRPDNSFNPFQGILKW